jgi:hypothetical protein
MVLSHPNIDRVNEVAAKLTIGGWFAGLAYFNWFAADAAKIAWWGQVLLIVVGMFAASIIIGGAVSLLMAAVTKMLMGEIKDNPTFFAWGAFISPVLAFFAAKYTLHFVGSL